MKKIIAYIFTVLLLLTSLTFGLSAEEVDNNLVENNGEIDSDTITRLLTEAWEFYDAFNNNALPLYDSNKINDFVDIVVNGKVEKFNYPCENYKTYSDLLAKAASIYTGDLVPTTLISSLYVVNNGKVYILGGAARPPKYDNSKLISDYKVLSNGNGKSELEIILIEAEPGRTITNTVEITQTEDGWRISGGTFFETIYHLQLNGTIVTPTTYDSTAVYIILFAICAAGIATLLSFRRKRFI